MSVQWVFLLVIVALCAAYFFESIKRLVRFLYLTTKIPGASVRDYVSFLRGGLFTDNMLDELDKLCASKRHQPWGMWLGSAYSVMISDCETASEVFKNKYMSDNKPEFFYNLAKQYVRKGLLIINGEEYMRHRKLLNPAFRKIAMESHVPLFRKETKALVSKLGEIANGRTVDVRQLIDDYFYAQSVTAFSSGTIVPEKYFPFFHVFKKGMAILHTQLTNPLYYWFFLKLNKSTQHTEAKAIAGLEELRKNLAEERRLATERLKTNMTRRQSSNLLDCMISEEGEDGLSEEEFFDECIVLWIAGADTTGCAANLCLLLLALHQDVQQRAYEEVMSVLGSSDRPADIDDLTQMVFIEMVIKEVLRLYPSGPIVAKLVDEEAELNGMVLPKGCVIVMNFFSLHRDPKIFKDPLKFEPERFAPELCEQLHPYAYLPFSHGTRTCPGQYLAMILLKLFLIEVLRKFKVLPGEGLKSMDDIKVKVYFVMNLMESSLRLISRGDSKERET